MGLVRRLVQHWLMKFTNGQFRRSYIALCNKRIAELEREYADLLKKPYTAARLSEIISELGSNWNNKLKYEDINSEANLNGAKSLWQIQNEVSDIVHEAKHKITIAKKSEDKLAVYIEGLLKLRYVLDEWETESECQGELT